MRRFLVAAAVVGCISLGVAVPRVVLADGTVTTIVGNGDGGFNGDHAGLETSINPNALAVDGKSGDVFFSDGARIRKYIFESKQVVTLAGGQYPSVGEPGDGEPKAKAPKVEINPTDLSLHAETGELYFVDYHANMIKKLTPAGDIEPVAGTGQAPRFDSNSPDGNALEIDIKPIRLVVEPILNKIFFVDRNSLIRELAQGFDKVTRVKTLAGKLDDRWRAFDGSGYGDRDPLQFSIAPGAISLEQSSTDILFVERQERVLHLRARDGHRSLFTAAPHEIRSGKSRTIFPWEIAVDPQGRDIYFVDSGGSQISKVAADRSSMLSWSYVEDVAGTGANWGEAQGRASDVRLGVERMAFRPRTHVELKPNDLYFIDRSRRIKVLSQMSGRSY